jgi:hypothetical protein
MSSDMSLNDFSVGWRPHEFTCRSAGCLAAHDDVIARDQDLLDLPFQIGNRLETLANPGHDFVAGIPHQRPCQPADGGTCRLGACGASMHHGTQRPRSGQRSDAITPLDPGAMAPVPPRHRPFAHRSRRDRPHHRNHGGGERCISWAASRRPGRRSGDPLEARPSVTDNRAGV